MGWLESIALGVAANGVTALLGYIIKYFIANRMETDIPQEGQAKSLAEVVDYYVEQQRLISRDRQPVRQPPTERRIVIEHRREREADSSEALAILFGIFVVAAMLSTIWNLYKLQLFWVTAAGVCIGWVISFYFVDVLKKVPQPHRPEDNLLSWGSMVVWLVGISGLYLGVYSPLYPSAVAQDELSLMVIQATQLLGAVGIYIAIVITAALQLTVGSVYRKALRSELPNKIEVLIWEGRWFGIVIAAIALLFGFLFVSGIWFQITRLA